MPSNPTGDGCLTPAEFEAGLHLLAAPITDEGLRSLTAACDLQADQRIPYCQEPVLMRCYAGGLQELVNTGMERVMAAHRLEMADIGEAHAADLKSIAVRGGGMQDRANASPSRARYTRCLFWRTGCRKAQFST